MDDIAWERREIHYSGSVQGVGFRYTTRTIAGRYELTGFVRNLSDGRVELVIEGRADQLDQLLRDINASLGHYIHDVHVATYRPRRDFDSFQIAF